MNTAEINQQTQQQSPEYRAYLADLQNCLKKLTAEQRTARARDIARYLGVSEAQWIAAAQDRVSSRQLRCAPFDIFNRINELGEVIAITRNDACVHELKGVYPKPLLDRGVLLVQGDPIDLRVFLGTIKTIWSVAELGRSSLQFFDQAGSAIHKIYCTEATDMTAYQQLADDYALEAVTWPSKLDIPEESLSPSVEQPQVLREAWLAMQDTHEFYGLVKRFKVTRVTAFKAVGEDLALKIDPRLLEDILQDVASRQLPVMCFVANPGAIQIYTGPVHTLYRKGPWYNIIDPSFNLHLKTDAIDSAWVVRKPTIDGWVTSLELYDKDESLLVQVFGARKPGQAELTEWRDIMRANCAN